MDVYKWELLTGDDDETMGGTASNLGAADDDISGA